MFLYLVKLNLQGIFVYKLPTKKIVRWSGKVKTINIKIILSAASLFLRNEGATSWYSFEPLEGAI